MKEIYHNQISSATLYTYISNSSPIYVNTNYSALALLFRLLIGRRDKMCYYSIASIFYLRK